MLDKTNRNDYSIEKTINGIEALFLRYLVACGVGFNFMILWTIIARIFNL